MKGTMQHQPGGARLGRVTVRQLELAEDLRLADHHRVETGADAEQMAHRVAALEAIERAGEQRGVDLAVGGEKATDFVDSAGWVLGHADDLDAVASRNQRGLGQRRRPILEPPERRDDFAVAIGQPLADRDRGRAMVDAGDKKLFVHPVRKCACRALAETPPVLAWKEQTHAQERA